MYVTTGAMIVSSANLLALVYVVLRTSILVMLCLDAGLQTLAAKSRVGLTSVK